MNLIVLLISLLPISEGIECTSFEVTDILAKGATPGHLSPNGLGFICGLKDGYGKQRFYHWHRRSLRACWKGPEPLKINNVADTVDNIQPTVTEDGLTMVFVRNFDDTWESNDLWMARRNSTNEAFDRVRPLDELNTDSAEAYPFITPDGSRLYYTTYEGIMVTEYDEGRKRFKDPKNLGLPWDILSCWLSSDELVILATGYGKGILCAERASMDEPFVQCDTLILPEWLVFISSPSLDAKGDLYLYASVEQDSYLKLMESGVRDFSMEGVKKKSTKDALDEYYGFVHEEHTLDIILILRCKGGK